MTLTQQFLIIAILPLSFLGMVAYLWRAGVPRRKVALIWTFTLVAATVWSSNVLRFYGGVSFPISFVFTWGVIGNYFLSVAAFGVLLTTLTHLSVKRQHGLTAMVVSVFLWLAALSLDPAIWRYEIPTFNLSGRTIRHFDLWAAVWMVSWLLPVMASWMLTVQDNLRSPRSLYRNQIHYWLLVLTLFFVGAALASIHQPGQVVWQEVGVLFIILAAYAGTVSIANTQLTDLQLVLRQILSRLSGTLIIFGLTWAALRFIVQGVTNLPTDTNPNLILTLAAALFAGLFFVIYRLVNALTRRLFVPSLSRRDLVMASYANTVGNLPEPAQLGQLLLRIIQVNLAVNDGWIFVTEEGVAGRLILRPLANLEVQPPQTADFDGDSPLVNYLRQNQTPLAQYDIDVLSTFDNMEAAEKEHLDSWQRVLYVPLHTGDRLVGLLALGGKHTGESYERVDFELLQTLATQISPLMAQAQNLANLRQINDYVFRQNQALARKNQHLIELSNLYRQFITLISPEMRKPFATINRQLGLLEVAATGDESQGETLAELSRQIDDLKTSVDDLIAVSGHVKGRDKFDFRPVHLDEIVHKVLRQLRTMADARQVHITYEPEPALPAVLGDEQQLQEAVHHVLHNAIKFNKVGGTVQLEHDLDDGHLCLHVIDSGVGMQEERLQTIWDGFVEMKTGDTRRSSLGLALTHFIVTAHGGYLEVRSQLEKGSVFSLYLPTVEE